MTTWIATLPSLSSLSWAAPLGAVPSPAAAPPSELPIGSLLDLLVKGGPVMIPIVACSLIALSVVIERALSLRVSRVVPADALGALRDALRRDPSGREARDWCATRPGVLWAAVGAALRRAEEGEGEMLRAGQEAGAREAPALRTRLRLLAVIAAVSPLLGLLGTITGMIESFQTVAASADALGRTELLARGIYEAMITTAGGLIVAIPTLMAYHWLSARSDSILRRIDRELAAVVESVSDQRRLRSEPVRRRADAAARGDAADALEVIVATPAPTA